MKLFARVLQFYLKHWMISSKSNLYQDGAVEKRRGAPTLISKQLEVKMNK